MDDPTTGERWYSPVYGPGNPVAPPLVADHTPDGRATGRVVLGRAHEGPPGLVHGGVVAALFDHMLARAVRAGGRGGLTAELTVTYRRPVRLGVPLLLTAKMVDADGRRTTARARLVAEDDPGTTLAEADGLFVAQRPDVTADDFSPARLDDGRLTGRLGSAGRPVRRMEQRPLAALAATQSLHEPCQHLVAAVLRRPVEQAAGPGRVEGGGPDGDVQPAGLGGHQVCGEGRLHRGPQGDGGHRDPRSCRGRGRCRRRPSAARRRG